MWKLHDVVARESLAAFPGPRKAFESLGTRLENHEMVVVVCSTKRQLIECNGLKFHIHGNSLATYHLTEANLYNLNQSLTVLLRRVMP